MRPQIPGFHSSGGAEVEMLQSTERQNSCVFRGSGGQKQLSRVGFLKLHLQSEEEEEQWSRNGLSKPTDRKAESFWASESTSHPPNLLQRETKQLPSRAHQKPVRIQNLQPRS